MKVAVTLEVGDALRRFIAHEADLTYPACTRDRRAGREATVKWLQQQLARGDAEHWKIYRAKEASAWGPKDYADAGAAVAYLRSVGKSDEEIQNWVMLQRARLQFPKPRDTDVI